MGCWSLSVRWLILKYFSHGALFQGSAMGTGWTDNWELWSLVAEVSRVRHCSFPSPWPRIWAYLQLLAGDLTPVSCCVMCLLKQVVTCALSDLEHSLSCVSLDIHRQFFFLPCLSRVSRLPTVQEVQLSGNAKCIRYRNGVHSNQKTTLNHDVD